MVDNSKTVLYEFPTQRNCEKPIEIYVFIDPLCPECWALEPTLKKLQMEYDNYLTIRHVMSTKLKALNSVNKDTPSNIAEVWKETASRSGMSCDEDIWFEDPISSPYAASVAIKAAELQSRRAGLKYLRKLQENVFLEKRNISKEEVLIQIAEESGIDVDEFKKDLHSEMASKAFQCDLKISREMEVDKSPTIVFFNEQIDEEGLKVTGIYPYEIYVQILSDLLQQNVEPKPLPSIETFMRQYNFVASREIEVVYNLSEQEVEKKMKKLKLKQVVEKVPVKYGTFWRYVK